MLAFSNVIRDLHRQAGETAQKKQQRDYESSYKSSASNDIYIGAEVLLRNNKRKDRKGGKFTLSVSPKIVCTWKIKSNQLMHEKPVGNS